MKQSILLALLIILYQFSVAQTWTKISVSDKLSVEFPGEPDFQEVDGMQIRQFITPDYIVSSLATDLGPFPEEEMGPDGSNWDIDEIIIGKLQAAKNHKLLKKKTIHLGSLEGREIVYTKDFYDMTGIRVFDRLYLIGTEIYSLEVWVISGKIPTKLIKKFFKSIVLK
ncbi:MAG: hypothetical protein H6581_16400 [Bacteroidia bacterium]|nr:hypothetical protein [Bacteroidia bacterium]